MATLQEEGYQHSVTEVSKFYKDAPDGEKLLEKILSSFEKSFKNPPTHDFEVILQKNFTEEETRCAMFMPTDEQVRYYPTILHVTHNLPADRVSEQRTRSTVLSLVYLVHRQSWSFLQEFVLQGGLNVISSMTNDDNLYYRGQAFEILLSITDCDSFDWFLPHNGNHTTRTLHNRLLSLSENTEFLSGLLENRKKSYPGGSFRALQLLAFWISWVRAMMTKDHILTLSEKVLKELCLWGEGEGEGLIDVEITLARTIYKDFSYDQFHRDQENNSITEVDSFKVKEIDDNTESHVSGVSGVVRGSCSFTDEEKMSMFVSGFEVPKGDNGDKGDKDDMKALPSAHEIMKILHSTSNVTAATAAVSNQSSAATAANTSVATVPDTDAAVNSGAVSNRSAATTAVTVADAAVSNQSTSETVSLSSSHLDDHDNTSDKSDADILSTAQQFKAEGNELFKGGKYLEALVIYEKTLTLLTPLYQKCSVSTEDNTQGNTVVRDDSDDRHKLAVEIGTLKVSIHFNCATSHWKLSEAKGLDSTLISTLSSSSPATATASTSSSPSSSLSDLILCETECRAALTIDPQHVKCVYRLVEMLLKCDRPEEALQVTEIHSIDLTNGNTIDDTMKAIRRKCLAAVISKDKSAVKIENNGLDDNGCANSLINRSDGIEIIDVNDNKTEKSDHKSENKSENKSTNNDISVISSTLGPQAAKHLKSLQARADREKNKTKHAWNGWVAPGEGDVDGDKGDKGDKEGEDKDEMKGVKEGVERDEVENEEEVEEGEDDQEIADRNAINLLPSNLPPLSTTKSNKPTRQNRELSSLISNDDFLAPTIRVKGAKKAERLEKAEQLARGSEVSKKNMSKAEKLLEKKEKHMVDKINDKQKEKEKAGKEKEKKKDNGKIVKKKSATNDAVDSYNQLKKLSIQFTKCLDSSSAIWKKAKKTKKCEKTKTNETSETVIETGSTTGKDGEKESKNGEDAEDGKMRNGQIGGEETGEEKDDLLEGLYDQMDGYVVTAIESFQVLWKDGATLKKLMTATIEEDFLHFLLTIAIKSTIEGKNKGGNKEENHNNGGRNGNKDKNEKNGSNKTRNDNDKNKKNMEYDEYIHMAIKLLHQMFQLDRFSTVFQLTLYDNNRLKSSLSRSLDTILAFIDIERKKLLATSIVQNDILNNDTNKNDNSNNCIEDSKEKKKILVSLEKSYDSIMKINTLLA